MKKRKSKYFWASLSFLVLGFCFLCLAIYFASNENIEKSELGFGFFSSGLALVSIGIAFHSVDIAKESKKIAEGSDKKMNAIANVQFIELIEKFIGYSDLKIQKKGSKTTYHTIFQLGIDLKKAGKFWEWTEEGQKTVFKDILLKKIFTKLKSAKEKDLLTDEEQNFVRKMEEDARKYGIIKEENC